MKKLIFLLTFWLFNQEVYAQLHFDEFSEVIKGDLIKTNQPDSFFVFINPIPCVWGDDGDWSKLLVFLYKKGGVWRYHATKIDKRGKWLIKSVSNSCSFPSSFDSYIDVLFLNAHQSAVVLSKEKRGEHTGYYVSLISNCGEKRVEIPYYNAPGTGHIIGLRDEELQGVYELFSLCLVNASGFDYMREYKRRIKKAADLGRIKF